MSIGLIIRRKLGRTLARWPSIYRTLYTTYQHLFRCLTGNGHATCPPRHVDIAQYLDYYAIDYPELSNPFSYYTELIDGLRGTGIELMPLYELLSAKGRAVGLRHDIDVNPGVALRMARYLTRIGICGSFYLLHTSPYYGSFDDSEFVRNPEMSELVRSFIVTGCELGLHIDPYWVDKAYKMDGAKAVDTELRWLRSQGAVVRGTVGHNSAPMYGCENSEIFRERVLWDRVVKMKGKVLSLGVLSEKKLGLQYEGSFAVRKKDINTKEAAAFCSNLKDADIRSEPWMKKNLVDNPLCDWEVDYQFWLIGKDRWVVGGKDLWEWMVGLDRMLELVRGLPEDSRSVVVVHPDYFTT